MFAVGILLQDVLWTKDTHGPLAAAQLVEGTEGLSPWPTYYTKYVHIVTDQQPYLYTFNYIIGNYYYPIFFIIKIFENNNCSFYSMVDFFVECTATVAWGGSKLEKDTKNIYFTSFVDVSW